MYDLEDLLIHPYFERVIKSTPLHTVLDSLTGVISRAYMLEYLRSLIEEGAEFTVAMIDLDNFKSYNDNYGHSVGDKVLSTVADSLIKYVGSRGIVGRFGGDEFMVIAFIGNDYHRVHDFYENMFNQGNVYNQSSVFRRDIYVDHLKLFISATLGSASFPKDARDFDGLFSLIDKTLYRGKFKGRNCYIIYLPQKHANLEIPKLARHSLFDTFTEMAAGFDGGANARDRTLRAFQAMKRNLHFHFLFRVSPAGQVYDVEKDEIIGECEDLSSLVPENYFTCSSRDEISSCPKLRELITPYGIHALLLLPLCAGKDAGFLMLCPEPNTLHIWQDEELAGSFMLVRLIGELPEGMDFPA